MLDTALLCVVLGVPSAAALLAIDCLARQQPTYRSHLQLQGAVGMFPAGSGVAAWVVEADDVPLPAATDDGAGQADGASWRVTASMQGSM